MATRKGSIESRALEVLKEIGATVNSIDRKKHLKIKWRYRGQDRTTVMSQTTSDRRAMLNALSFLRRQIKEIDDAGLSAR